MARKQEFRPDRSGTQWFSRLHITQAQRRSILKWTLCGIVLLVLALLQDVVLSRFRLMGATTDLVPCAIFLVCVMAGAQSGCIFTLVASCLYLFSGTAPGTYAMAFITLIGVCVSIFCQAFLKKGFLSAMLCTLVCMVLYELGIFGIGLFLELTFSGRILGFCVTAGLSLVAAPILYPIFRLILSIGGDTWKK